MALPNSARRSTRRSTARPPPTPRSRSSSGAATSPPDGGLFRRWIYPVARNSKHSRFPLMNWRSTMAYRKRKNPADLPAKLAFVGLTATAASFNDFIARAARDRWSPLQILEEIARSEMADRTQRSFERRLAQAMLGRFKPIADFDWDWPTTIDRPLIRQSLTLDFIEEARNLILLGANGLGKTLITKNIAYAAVTAGYSALFRSASELISDLQCDSPYLRRQRLALY